LPKWLVGVLLLFAVYFPAAWWAERSYRDLALPGSWQLLRPFVRQEGFGWLVTTPLPEGELVVYEDDRPLERTDSFHDMIAVPGRFLHDGPRVLFSTQSDPNSNGHHYRAVQLGSK
jgi:hypothetical protein